MKQRRFALVFCLAGLALIALTVPFDKMSRAEPPIVARKRPNKKTTAQEGSPKSTQDKRSLPKWIWRNVAESAKPASKIYLRREIRIRGVTAARLYGACDDRMTVYLDGQQVLTHADATKPAFKDITPNINRIAPGGKQVIAIEAENPGGGAAGVLLRLELESGWQKTTSVVTDQSWRVATQAEDGWKTPDFVVEVDRWQPATIVAALGGQPWPKVTAATLAAVARMKQPTATPVERLKIANDFRVELLHSVPQDQQGSWVNMCVDPKGRLIVSDQYGGLFRVTPPPIGSQASIKIEKIEVDIGEAQGLLWAFDSLYVVVNRGKKYDSGLYRVRDTDGDDQLDSLETLRKLDGSGGEHGPHAVLLAPDGESLYVVCGNKTFLTAIDRSRVPQVWDEDQLLPRVYGRGFMKGTRAPGGYICRIDPDGETWELVATGFRNQYDAAFNATGELFTYDADMEWDMNTPWYRPTRVCHVVSGAEFGWRNGGGKWPVYYPDSLPPVVNVGPGSPTGICFGYGSKFPAKYQNALFICDWSYGKLYALHLEPQGASYGGRLEEFVTGTPLPLTDLVINEHDGALYFAIGGRRVQSGLYRVTYQGRESTAPASVARKDDFETRKLRKQLENLHLGDHPRAVDEAWPHLRHTDRFIRYAARIAIEHRPLSEWRDRALAENDPRAALTALLALARQFGRKDKGTEPDIDTPLPDWRAESSRTESAERAETRGAMLAALERLDWQNLSTSQRIELLRVYTLTFLRIGPPTAAERSKLIARLDPHFPGRSYPVNSELAQVMVYLQSPTAAEKIVELLKNAPTQEQQIDFAKTLRHLRVGWTAPLREEYFEWFVRAGNFRGGASFRLFVENIKNDAVAMLSEPERGALAELINTKPESTGPVAAEARPLVKNWKLDDLVPLVETRLTGRDFERGQKMFAAAKCFACHRFDNQGGAIGPDLTALSGRFSPREILESIVDPSRVISDQYQAVEVITLDGRVVTGRIVNLAGDSISINTNMLDPFAQVRIDRKQIEEITPSRTSMMPAGLLDTLSEEEILDLMAYLLSRGDPDHEMFQPANEAQ